ncbi:hypothetical protein Salat_0331600 [Sesamum alatum]|uniref:Uncharacterized protein n=1 Tax=Sesamum alatum TaxID=300844 RepID=A0AAE2CZ37_9LAMI|nr:hypothetical protein Salat_0331600 [Sesamum alatum]
MFRVVSADFTSSDSLSFSGLVCIQDQQSTCPPAHLLPTTLGKGSPGMHQPEQGFEFSCSTASSIIGSPNNFPAEKKLPDGQPAAKNCSYPNQVPKQIGLAELLSPIPDHRRTTNVRSSNRMQNSEVKRTAKEKRTAGRKSIGQKIFSSFATPCRDCRTIEPNPRVNTNALQ